MGLPVRWAGSVPSSEHVTSVKAGLSAALPGWSAAETLVRARHSPVGCPADGDGERTAFAPSSSPGGANDVPAPGTYRFR